MTLSYAALVNIDPAWTPAGKQSARRLGLDLDEVVAVLYSPKAIQLQGPGTVWFVDLVNIDDVVTVIVDQQARNTTIYEITLVRWAGETEIAMWRSKQP